MPATRSALSLPSADLPDIRCGRFARRQHLIAMPDNALEIAGPMVRRNSSVGRARHS